MANSVNRKFSILKPVKEVVETVSEVAGFSNRWGESNCFLNSALQVLFHLESFPGDILESSKCGPSIYHYCLCCGLKQTLQEYQKTLKSFLKSPIDITDLRKELASVYLKTGEFEINYPADSMEALNALLIFIHNSHINKNTDTSNKPCAPKCPSHLNFELLVEETLKCECESVQKSKWDYSTFSQQFYVNEVFEELSESASQALLFVDEGEEETCLELSNAIKVEGRMQEYIKSLWQQAKYPICPAECPNPSSKKHLRLLTTPKVFIISLTWKDFRPSIIKILQVFASISLTISLDNLYDCLHPSTHILKSIILYGAGHYICAINIKDQWTKIDDEHFRTVGDWKALIDDLIKNRFYPVGLFYEESQKKIESEISPQEWMRIERRVLESVKTSQETAEESEWECECGGKNHFYWKVCKVCNKIRSNIRGWACKKCTFINENYEFSCEACGEDKYVTVKTRVECSKCGRMKESESDLCSCSKVCRKCGISNCTKCFSGYECVVCSEYIPRDELFYCVRCKFKSNLRQCGNCSKPLNTKLLVCQFCLGKLWKCSLCNIFNVPATAVCAEIGCMGKRRETMNFNKVQKEKAFTGSCVGCGVKQKKFGKFCLNCGGRSLGDKCAFCKVECRSDLCENCIQVTVSCSRCGMKGFFMDVGCAYCKLN